MSQITTHILDTSKGKPAADVAVVLYEQQDDTWSPIAADKTNKDGRIADLLEGNVILVPGNYKLRFATQEYFDKHDISSLYPFIEIVFNISNNEHYHVPLLLNPFGYSTYRGS